MPSLKMVDALTLDNEFDLDIQILPGIDNQPPEIRASGTCGGCPPPSGEGSTCHFSCQDSCGGNCTFQSDCGGQ